MFRRVLLQLFLIVVVLFAAYVGIIGAEAVALKLFGVEYFDGPFTVLSLKLWLMLVFIVFGCTMSSFGALFLVVLPVATKFPEACQAFSFMHKPSKRIANLLRWFAKALEMQATETEKDA